MGAHSFEVSAYGKTADHAFSALVEQATYEFGHDPYNGTISTNSSFIMVSYEEGESVPEWMRRMADHKDVHKWGPCGCVKDPDTEKDGEPLWHFSGWAAC